MTNCLGFATSCPDSRLMSEIAAPVSSHSVVTSNGSSISRSFAYLLHDVIVDRHRARAQDLVRFDDVPDRSLQAMAVEFRIDRDGREHPLDGNVGIGRDDESWYTACVAGAAIVFMNTSVRARDRAHVGPVNPRAVTASAAAAAPWYLATSARVVAAAARISVSSSSRSKIVLSLLGSRSISSPVTPMPISPSRSAFAAPLVVPAGYGPVRASRSGSMPVRCSARLEDQRRTLGQHLVHR